jgi:serine/threonine protein kinase
MQVAPEKRAAFLDGACGRMNPCAAKWNPCSRLDEQARSSFLRSPPAVGLGKGARIGGYEIQSLLGASGMGEVYRARDLRLRRDVAIKVLPSFVSLDPERLRRFEREALATAALNHPNILAVYQVGTSRCVQSSPSSNSETRYCVPSLGRTDDAENRTPTCLRMEDQRPAV